MYYGTVGKSLTQEEIDEIALSLVPSLAVANNSRFISSQESSKSVRTSRDAYVIPTKFLNILIKKIRFKGTEKEFGACLGRVFSKCSIFKNLKGCFKPTDPNIKPPSPFGYPEYESHFNAMVTTNINNKRISQN